MMKNMKIKVETDEHGESNLVEILEALERLGYGQCFSSIQYNNFIICRDFGVFFDSDGDNYDFPITTIAELKEM